MWRKHHAKQTIGQGTALWFTFSCLLLLLINVTAVYASGGPTFRYGAVYTRSLILGPSHQPIYVEYNDDGSIGSEIGEAVGPRAHAHVMATEQYLAYLLQLEQLKTHYPDLELAYREDTFDYNSNPGATPNFYISGSYTTVDGDPIDKRDLAPSTLVVALKPNDQRYSTDPEQLILLELPINPMNMPKFGSQSLLLGGDGAILWDSSHNIGYKTGYYDSNTSGTTKYYGPVPNVKVENFLAQTSSNENGVYQLNYPLPPCPGVYYRLDTPIYTELYYKRFNPREEGSPYPYFMKRDNVDYCNGFGELSMGGNLVGEMTQLALQSLSSTPSPIYKKDFIVDLMVLAGQARMDKQVKVGSATRYDGSRATLSRISQSEYDFDSDAEPDKAVLGRIITVTDPDTNEETQKFEELTAEQNPEIQGVWLSSLHDFTNLDITATLPDLTRLTDWSADFADRGLLSQITLDDLRNTDLFVFRESDGTLVTERHGLKDSEITDTFLGVNAEAGTFHYTIDIIGALEGIMNDYGYTNGGDNDYKRWQVGSQMAAKFYKRQADHLRPGEQVRIIAINRATGYMGSLTTQLQAAGSTGNTGEISFPIDDIILSPPNVRIWAERKSEIKQGMTKGTVKEQAIGNEGAGLADDTLITLYSEWLDKDGRPLPEGLADYGYTGRLAKVIAPNQLAAIAGNTNSGNGLSQFAIKPGRQVQVIRLPETVFGEQHLYVQVSGEPISSKPDFSTSGLAANGTLQYRPDHYVPFKTKVYDEKSSLMQQQSYQEAKNAYEAGAIKNAPKKPEPFYRWVYRPEFQFSVYDLAMDEIRLTDVEAQVQNILELEEPLVTSMDQMIELFYDLSVPEHDPLTSYSYNGDREMVFSVGGQEIKATIGRSQELSFDNLEFLSFLAPEDFLTINLYSNNDGENLLWEWDVVSKLTVKRVRETDNYCNAAPNRKQFDTGYGLRLILATEPDKPNRVEVTLDGVMGDSAHTRILAEGAGQWFETQLEKCELCKRWKVSFEVPDIQDDTLYSLYSYDDENGNELRDEDEAFMSIDFLSPELGGRSSELKILVASPSGYDNHMMKYAQDVLDRTGNESVGYETFTKFTMGAPTAQSYQSLTYRQEEVGTQVDTSRDDYLVNSWTHGAGANMVWSESYGEHCDAVVPVYTYKPGDDMHDLVMRSPDFHKGLVNIIDFPSFKRDIKKSMPCTDGEKDCIQFETSAIDADLEFWGLQDKTEAANLFAALGLCKFKYDNTKVRYKVELNSNKYVRQYDIKMNGEIYDIYDFNYGKAMFPQLPQPYNIDFNSDGAIVEIGHESSRSQGMVFISSIPFDITYSIYCEEVKDLAVCSYIDHLTFSEPGDF